MAKVSCMCLMLLLLVGTQLATSKSVDETFKDDRYSARPLALSKRAVANEESKDEEVTTVSEEEEDSSTEYKAPVSTTAKPKPRRQTAKATTIAPTTPVPDEDDNDDDEATTVIVEEADDDEPATVKPLSNEKEKPKKKPKPSRPVLLNRLKPDEDEQIADDKPTAADKPASNLLPPMPFSYYPPQSYNGFLVPPPPMQNYPAFAAPWASFNPVPAPTPYDYPYPSGPAFSDRVGAGSGTGVFAGGFASASASAGANGQGGTVALSSTPIGGVQQTATSFDTRGSFTPPAGNTQVHKTDSSITLRGSFPADGDSVGIEVNGPAPAGVPAYTAGPNYGAVSGPGYSASASFGTSPGGGIPYQNSIPTYGAYNPVDFQSFFNQYFAALQAQQQAFQQQLQAQIEAQRQAGGTFASGGAFITNDNGMIDPNAQVYVNTRSSPNYASSSTSVNSHSGFGGSRSSVYVNPFPNQNNGNTVAGQEYNFDNNNRNSIWDQSNRVDSNFGASGGYSGYPTGTGGHSGQPQSAVASANLGPGGGFQAAQVNPAAPGIFSRFAEDIPPPSGGSYGVFSSSSSSSGVGPDGKQVSHKSATVGVNDNGKISYKTVHDP